MWLVIRTQQQFWIVAAAMGLVALGAIIAFVFAVQYVLQEWDVLAAARAGLGGDEAVRRGVGVANDLLVQNANDLAVLESSFADPKNPLPFIESIEALGRRLGVRAELTLTSGSDTLADRYQINADGEFIRVMAFLRSLEALPFLIVLGDVTISRAGTGDAVRLATDVTLVSGPNNGGR
ncbi:hypothetical protein C4552_00800 [Candidatus Parcubacteria bacterium]|nr:MAG: hypothetical protein C4552_00800 [Candidatus Parcubacteria bacterium]